MTSFPPVSTPQEARPYWMLLSLPYFESDETDEKFRNTAKSLWIYSDSEWRKRLSEEDLKTEFYSLLKAFASKLSESEQKDQEAKRMPVDLFFENYFKDVSKNHPKLLPLTNFEIMEFHMETDRITKKDREK